MTDLPKIGDKYIIEIDRTYASKKHAVSRYGFKGFANFVLDAKTIGNLLKHNCIRKYEPGKDAAEAYHNGMIEGYKVRDTDIKTNAELIDELKHQEYQRGYADGLDSENRDTCKICKYDTIPGTEEPCVSCCCAYVSKFKPKEKEIEKPMTNAQKFEETFNLKLPNLNYKINIMFKEGGFAKVIPADWWDKPYKEPDE